MNLRELVLSQLVANHVAVRPLTRQAAEEIVAESYRIEKLIEQAERAPFYAVPDRPESVPRYKGPLTAATSI